MSDYSDHDRPPHRYRTRERECEPEYVSEKTYMDFPPPGAEFRQTKYGENAPPRRGHRDHNDDNYHRRDSGRPSRDFDYSSDDYERSPEPQRRKSVVDNLKGFGETAGLGGVIGAVIGRPNSGPRSQRPWKERHERGYDSEYDGIYRDDRRSCRHSSSERSRNRGGKSKKNERWEQAAKAAIVAGAVEAFRSRKTPGAWKGAKGQRIATAALGAAGIDSLVDKNSDKHGKRHVAESAIGGLVASRLANRSHSRSQGPGRHGSPSFSHSRSRSRYISRHSRSHGRSASRGREEGDDSTLKNVAGAGAVLAAGKALYGRVRSKSRGAKGRDRSRSVSSEDSYVPSRSRLNHGYSDRGRSMDGYSETRGSADQDRRLATTARAGALMKGKDNSSDSESTTDIEQKRKKVVVKELLTAGLATVATIQAARGVYASLTASENRRKLVSEGEISPDEARRRKLKNILQDVTAVGIAALGIKSAFSKWQEMNEHRHSVQEIETRRRKRRKIRDSKMLLGV